MAYIGKITDTSSVTGLIGSTLFGTCATAAGTAAKVGTLADFDALIHGVTVHLKMTNSNTAASATLNVNSTGAKAIYRYGTTAPGTNATESWAAGEVVSFTYIEDTPGTASSGHWYMNDKEPIKTASYGSASAGTAISVPTWTFADVSATLLSDITDVSVPVVTASDKTVAKLSNVADVTIPNVTGNTEVTIPNVTANEDVTFNSATKKTVMITAAISSGVLTFTTGDSITETSKTASKVTLGTALKASKVTLGTALTAKNFTNGTETVSKVTLGTALTAKNFTASSVTASKATAGTAISVPNISVSSKTVVIPV